MAYMADVIGAIKEAFDASSITAALKARVWRNENEPANPGFPYVIVNDDEASGFGSDLESYSVSNEHWLHELAIEVRDKTPRLVESYSKEIEDMLATIAEAGSWSYGAHTAATSRIVSMRVVDRVIRHEDKGVEMASIKLEFKTKMARRKS